ncbi:E3 ubiquitin-protein ligase TRIM36 [Dissostichus eleginoides]|uniref:E3 ubiquitin-protein ligase TRIM36 n=1 Tax=Dissostichus eleginoides TaxID=100907 RepID=A0AAD9BSU4_DISEL|nr:E3 ubiquitin-protein ligase TRIM36 [Dissostichus eleginoides]
MSDNLPKDLQVILCDMCTEEDRKPARKTCMKYQHRLHNMKTFSTAHKELMEKLNAEQQALLTKTDDVNVSLEKWEKSEREKISRSSVRLVEAVTSLRDIALTSVQSSVSARMVAIKTSKSSMQEAQKEKDTFRFLQMYSQVHQDLEKAKAVDLRKGLEPGSDRDKLVQEIRENGEKMVKQAGHFWGSLLILVDPENHQELVATSSDLIFDPQIFGPGMSLSEDKRKVFYNSSSGQCTATLLICSTLSTPNFQRWMVSFSQDSDWIVGLCDKQSAKNVMDGPVYGLRCEDNKLSSLTTENEDSSDASVSSTGLQTNVMTPTKKKPNVFSALLTQNGDKAAPRPEALEVFWNFVASSLSFFSRTGQYQREEIITIKAIPSNWDLAPFVQVGKKNAQIIRQNPWQCTCGKAYQYCNNRYIYGMGFQSSRQDYCSCGALLGGNRITEVVCEFL